MVVDQSKGSSQPFAKPISRREFLYYLWGGSAVLLSVEAGAAALWFAFPHIRYGEDSGVFQVKLSDIPNPQVPPVPYSPAYSVAFWLRNTEAGLLAFNMVCPFRGCLYKWALYNGRFECPCCGSKFTADGDHILGEGPASRNLDRHPIFVRTSYGMRITPADGSPVSLEDAREVIVDTRFKILGRSVIPYKT